MRKDEFLLAEYNALRQESRHNDQLRHQMIRFFIGLVLAVLAFLKFAPSSNVSEESSNVSEEFQGMLLIAVAFIGCCVMFFHALERAKNKENDYLFDWIRHYFWTSGETDGSQSRPPEAGYAFPRHQPNVTEGSFWALGTYFVYAVVIWFVITLLLAWIPMAVFSINTAQPIREGR